ncbi:MAG: tetratricopeptide repeat protein [Rhodocyclaceae bacterium]|nr:tetratricopeptide repeat protein [Rhodocyclaceae bacterium]
MASYDLEEQEQLDELKTWWKMHGNLVTAVVTAVALAVVAWQGWNWWQRQQSAKASILFSVVQQAAATQDAKRARDVTGELIDKYAGTSYAGMAALLSAKVQADGGDAKTARAELAWAADNAKDDALRDLARLRLAATLFDDKSYDEALKQLATEPAAAFVPRFDELKGDVFAAQGKPAEARAAYQAALTKMDELAKTEGGQLQPYRDVLQTKLEALGSAK